MGLVLKRSDRDSTKWERIGLLDPRHTVSALKYSESGLEILQSERDLPSPISLEHYSEYFDGYVPREESEVDVSRFVATMLAAKSDVPLFQRTLLPKAKEQCVSIE